MKPGRIIISSLPRLLPIILCAFGWYLARWFGALVGFVIGCLLALITWVTTYYFLRKTQIQKRRLEISGLSDEQLKAIAVDPTSRDLGYAIAELERRGLKNIRPSMKSLLDLLTSPNANRRALGYSYLGIMYPTAFTKIAKEDSSSSDAPEVIGSEKEIAVFQRDELIHMDLICRPVGIQLRGSRFRRIYSFQNEICKSPKPPPRGSKKFRRCARRSPSCSAAAFITR
jgi:hypothetical protein